MTDIYNSAIALLDGGWRPEDREQMKAEYELTDSEVDAIIAAMVDFMSDDGEDPFAGKKKPPMHNPRNYDH